MNEEAEAEPTEKRRERDPIAQSFRRRREGKNCFTGGGKRKRRRGGGG